MRPFATPTRWRLMACLLLGGVCIALLASYVVWKLREAALEHAAFLEKYESLEEGMTEEEVKKILGPQTPDPLFEYPGGSLGEHRCYWPRGEDEIFVAFDGSRSAKRFDWGIVEKSFSTRNTVLRRARFGTWPYWKD
jgi:hypothetical protein